MRLALHARADLRLQTATTPHPGYCEGIGPPRGGTISRSRIRETAACPAVRMVLVTSTAFPNSRIYGLCGDIDLIVPSVDDRVAVEIMDELHDALFQLVFRADADVTKHGAGGFGEEPSTRLSQEPCSGVNTN